MTLQLDELRSFLINHPIKSEKLPKAGILCSDAGYNTQDILALQDTLAKSNNPLFEVSYFFSDNSEYRNYSNYFKGESRYYDRINPRLHGFDIRRTLKARGIQTATIDIDDFYRRYGFSSKTDKCASLIQKNEMRALYYEKMELIIEHFEKRHGKLDFLVNDTFLSIITGKTLHRTIVNCHWGDLTKVINGKRIYAGYHGLLRAMQNGEKNLYSTVHLVNRTVDGGQILFRSHPFKVDFQRDASYGFPFTGMTDKEVVAYLNDPDNRETAVRLETLYEAFLRLHLDSEMLPLAVLAVSKNLLSPADIAKHFDGKNSEKDNHCIFIESES